MLTGQTGFANPFVERLMSDVTLEQARFERDLRASKREKIVLPVFVITESDSTEVHGFTRNLSATGACIIANHSFERGEKALVELYRLNGDTSELLSECRWVKEFGANFYVSGWQFIRVKK